MRSYVPESFHRLPLHESTCKQWLVVLQVDVDTPIHILKQKDYRVCSAHFDPDDIIISDSKPRQRMRLKKSAIPKATQLSPEASASENPAMYPSEMAAVPQSTPQKPHKPRRSDWSTGLSFTISSPKQPSVRQRTRPSSSGQYTARPASWQYPQEDVEEGAASALDTSVQDMSISFGEMDLDRKDISFVPFSDTTSSSPSSGSVSSSGSTNGWAGRKWIVDEAKLMELFRTCSQCGVAIEDKRVATRASQIIIHWTCLKGHTGEWASCTDQRKMGRNNLLSCAATFFTGATYSDIKEWAKLINLQLPSKSQFYAIQSKYLIPVTNHAYKGQQQKILERIFQLSAAGQKLEMCGDARCDSPGYSCKYSTYSFQDDATKEILHFELVQVTEASSSVAMEAMGFQRGLNHLLDLGLDIGVMVTDRSPSIRKLMRESYGNIRHEYDPWHVNKSLKKKLASVSNKKNYRELRPWLRSISNHLYWSCSSSHGDEQECVRRWTSVLHHIRGIHRWEENGREYQCAHPPLSEEDQEKKRWLEHDSPAFRALTELVEEKTLLRDLRQMALFKHTGSLEVFHNVTLKYAPKRLHFAYDSMRARTELAIIDHNMNIGRKQKTLEGKETALPQIFVFSKQYRNPQYKYVYTKTTQQWVAKPVYEPTSQEFRKDLMEDVLNMREEKSLEPWPRPPPLPKRLLQNIAPVPRPDPSELVAQRLSRFKQLL
ncbi:11S globulin [Labeo rohita]|uniref:11S globulin n=1 Tax=Labeo rohita TaxID=84645 RepID=A0ABQ8MWC0_LABRO|nr:11S globulin [Labeo rohita]